MIYIFVDSVFVILRLRQAQKSHPHLATSGEVNELSRDRSNQDVVELREVVGEAVENGNDVAQTNEHQELAQPRSRGLHHLLLLCGLVFAASITASLVTTVMGLTSVADPSQRSWGFGQMVALASTCIPISSALIQFSVSCRPGQTEPRYCEWHRLLGSPCSQV